jgi:hypothetical protein
MLEYKVTIEQNRLDLGQEAVVAIQVRPSRLHHPNLRLREVMDYLHHPLSRRHKVRIEDCYKLAPCHIEALVERARLIPMPVAAMEIHNRLRLHPRKSAGIALDSLPRYFGCLIRRIVQHLNFEPIPRIIQFANRVNQPVDDKLLIEDRQLDCNEWKLTFGEPHRRLTPLRRIFLVLEVEPYQLIPMDPVERQDNHDDEIGDQHGCIERIPSIETMEVINLVGIVRLPIMAEALRSEQQREDSRRYMKEREQVEAPTKVPYYSILRDTMQNPSYRSNVADPRT